MAIRYLSGVNIDSNTLVVDDVNNRVGIGTASPGTILEVSSATPIFRISSSLNSSFHGIEFRNGGALDAEIKQLPETGEFRISNGRNSSWGGFITLYTDTAERMRITSAGNVGIGTTSPSEKLDVNGNGRFLNSVTTFAGSSGYYGRISTEYNYPYIETFIDSIAAASWDSRLVFRTNSNAGGATTGMVIDPFGKVGIGTTSPAAKLTVSGTTYLNLTSDYFGASTTVQISSGGGSNSVGILSNTFYLYPYSSNTTTSLVYGYNGNASWGLTNAGGNSRFDFYSYSAGSSIMSITSSGNVGIGTTSPSYKLDVSGQIRVDNGVGNGSGQALIVGGSGDVTLSDGGSLFFGAYDYGGSTYIRGYDSGDVMYFYSNGTNAVYFKSDRAIFSVNVGIGTASPGAKLEVAGQGSGSVKMGSTGFGGDWVGISLSGNLNTTDYNLLSSATNASFFLNRPSGGDMLFRHNNVDQMIIKSSGNVGIGTTAPSSILHIDGIDPFVRINNVNSANNQGIKISYNYSDTHGFHFTYNANAAGAYIDNTYPITSGQPWGDIYFRQNNAGTMTPRITIKADGGNVGIGTTSPSSKLHVSSSGETTLIIDSTSAGTARINLTGAGGGAGAITSTVGGLYVYASGANPITFNTNGSERLRVESNGNVGIGTTSPSTKLDVIGTGIFGTMTTSRGSYSNGLSLQNNGGQATSLFLWQDGVASAHIGSPANSTSLHIVNSYNTGLITDPNAIVLNNTGNVGIGTATPGAKIHVVGTESRFGGVASGFISVYNATGRSGYIQANGGTDLRIASDSDPMTMYVNGSERMRISSAGALKLNAYGSGSNTGTATQRLAVDASGNVIEIPIGSGPVDGNGTANYVTKWSDADTITNSQIFDNGTDVGVGTSSPFVKFDVRGEAVLLYRPSGNAYAIYSAANSTYSWQFGINNGSDYVISGGGFTSPGTEYMRITAAGNVGIGTTSPAVKLQVAGNIRLGVGGSNDKLDILHGAGSGDYGAIRFYAGVDEINTIHSFPAAWQGGTIYSASANALNFSVNSTFGVWYQPDVVFPNGGSAYFRNNVGIGTTGPSYKLHTVVASAANADIFQAAMAGVSNGFSVQRVSSSFVYSMLDGGLGINNASPTQALHVTGNARITGAFIDSNNEAGTSGQVLSSTGSGTDWVTPATTTASSLYDLLPAARTTYDWTVQMTSGTWADIFSSNTVLSNGTWMVQVYVSDFASGGQQYQETYSGVMSWGNANSTNQGGASAISEVVLHRSGHAANAGQFYLRTQERASSTLLLQGMVNYSHTSNTTINFKFVKVF